VHENTSPAVAKLLRAFMQFKRLKWHQHLMAGCTHGEVKVLFCISHGKKHDATDMKVSEISRLLHVTPPTVTQMLNGLEAQGLIERHVDQIDRRAVGVTLTEKGQKVTQEAMEAYTASIIELTEYLGEERSNQLAELLSIVFGYFQEKAACASESPWGNEKA
jgi:DNA-binding MarR family transcriptional regulator